MVDMENELKDLRERNIELVQKVQYWKMTAAQRENEKLELMKEINELRLKLSRLRSGGAAQATKLDAALQSASEEALSHLVQASSAVARTLELAKTYMQDRQELDTDLPRWSSLSNTPASYKVNRVPPMLIGGHLMQPVVSLSRTLHSNSRLGNRSANQQNRSVTERTLPMPMHMLQDVYIPLTRIDAGELPNNNLDDDMEVNDTDDIADELGLDDSGDGIMEESHNSDNDNFEESRRLDSVTEEIEPEDEVAPPRPRVDNPLEGPSWLLDGPENKNNSRSSTNFEPDSTTEFQEDDDGVRPGPSCSSHHVERVLPARSEFSPTVRRRRASPPPASPRSPYLPRPRRLSNSGRILKVLVAKMRLNDDDDDEDVLPPKRPNLDINSPEASTLTPNTAHTDRELVEPRRQTRDQSPRFQIRDTSPSKRLMRFDAPSPNGSTDCRVIVQETRNDLSEPRSSGVSRINRIDSHNNHNQNIEDTRTNPSIDNRNILASQSRDSHSVRLTSQSRDNYSTDNRSSRDSRDSDSSGSEMAGETRARRRRKDVVYKEKPLNRKLRRL